MQLDCGKCVIRSWRRGDERQLAVVANDPEVARYMYDSFPNPYTMADALSWVELNEARTATNFAVTVDEVVAGGIGYSRLANQHRFCAEWGYWLGRPFWGRGIATAAALQFIRYLFDHFDIERLQAHVFVPNVASMRVLEKSGHVREGVLRRCLFKNRQFYDVMLYALTRDML